MSTIPTCCFRQRTQGPLSWATNGRSLRRGGGQLGLRLVGAQATTRAAPPHHGHQDGAGVSGTELAQVLFNPRRERATQRSGVARALETKFLLFWVGQERDSVLSWSPCPGGCNPALNSVARKGLSPVAIEHQVAERRQLPHYGVHHCSWRQGLLHADRLHQGVGEHPVVVVRASGPQHAGDHIDRKSVV